jgi:oxygen-independent coproporphyrinogen-3 oxidase
VPPGVYISWPFCSQKCTYCNFASGVFPKELEASYGAALLRELGAQVWPEAPDTVYLGGGTPSQMPVELLARCMACVPGRPWREATLEAAPGTITAESAAAWRSAGVNRVSLGVQSFVPAEASRTGRRHTPEIVTRDVEMLRQAGIANFNIDLIAGLPGQTEASWEESLAWVERLHAPHVSVYMLEVDEDSRLGQEVLLNGKRYGARTVPDDEIIIRLYERAVERLEALGICRYEISNFARAGFESTHNLKYWQLEPYGGIGADAHSFDGVLRWQNEEAPADYARRMNEEGSARVEQIEARLGEERFFVGLRLRQGVDAGLAATPRQRAAIDGFIAAGLLENGHGRLRLTDRGVLLSNEVFAELIA